MPSDNPTSEYPRMLTISGKALGHKRPLFDDFSIPLPRNYG